MDTMNSDINPTVDLETDADRRARIAWEVECIAQADADMDAGFYVDFDEMRAWVYSLDTDTPLPPPPTRRR